MLYPVWKAHNLRGDMCMHRTSRMALKDVIFWPVCGVWNAMLLGNGRITANHPPNKKGENGGGGCFGKRGGGGGNTPHGQSSIHGKGLNHVLSVIYMTADTVAFGHIFKRQFFYHSYLLVNFIYFFRKQFPSHGKKSINFLLSLRTLFCISLF